MPKKLPFDLYIGTTAELSQIPEKDGNARANTEEQSFSVDNVGGIEFKIQNGKGTVDKNYASAYGLEANKTDAASKQLNTQKLAECINKYGEIVIDDIYYFSDVTNTTLTNPSAKIHGTKNGKMVLAASSSLSPLFNVTFAVKEIVVEDLTIEGQPNAGMRLFMFPQTTAERVHLSQFIIRNCSVSGNVRVCHWVNTNTELVFDDIGIDELGFYNNTVNGITTNFVQIESVPVRTACIENNTVHNFSYALFYIGIVNGGNYAAAALQNKKIFVRNNTVTEDDAWRDTSLGDYHCFVLYEGLDCTYTGNYAEGIKSDTKISVYDLYANCQNIEYTNNTWKNIISFAAGSGTTLMKSKGGPDGLKHIRIYKNNYFYLEEAFAARLGKSSELLSVNFYEFYKPVDLMIIQDNYFDVYKIKFQASAYSHKSIMFQNNIVNVVKMTGVLFYTKAVNGSITVKNNNINAIDATTTVELIKIATGGLIDKIIVNDNIINIPFTYIINFQTSNAPAGDFIFKNNEITNISEVTTTGFIYGGDMKNTHIADNLISSKVQLYESRTKYGNGCKKEKYTLLRKSVTNENNALALSKALTNNETKKQKYRRTYTFEGSGGITSFYYEFSIYFDSADSLPKVEFVNETETFKIMAIGVAGSSYPKLISTGDVTNTYRVKFNTDHFFIDNFVSDTFGYVTIKTVSAFL